MEEPDFVVIGAGSAGSVVAERLSLSGRYKVLVLEAGGSDQRFFVQMPLGYGKTYFDERVNWKYETEADEGLGFRSDYWPRGKLLGGSSSINAMVWIRGARQDFDDWQGAGNPGWGWDDMLPIFKAIEHNEAGGNEWRGQGGPLHISDIRNHVHPLTYQFIKAGKEVGLAYNDDFNGACQDGVGIYQLTSLKGRRNSAARAFLRPAMGRKNLRLLTHAHVAKILFEGKRARSVEFYHKGNKRSVRAGCEIIVCAGSINSPQLLQLSGIGNEDALKGNGINVVRHVWAVGQNLQDHQGINYTFRANQPTLNDVLRPLMGKLKLGMQYLVTGKGPLSTSINHGGGFFKTDKGLDRPNMQLYFQAFSTVIPRIGERPVLTPDPFSGFSIGLSNCRVFSSGRIELNSSDPFAKPKIFANAFSDERDLHEMLDGVKFLRKLSKTHAMGSIIEEEILPGNKCEGDEALIDDIGQRAGTVFHPVSTCRMGPEDKMNVVDARLRVHGIDGLRVVDASIFPNIITGNTNAAAIAVGWKGAQMILEDNG